MVAAAASTESCAETKIPVPDDEDDRHVTLIHRAQWLRAAILGANDGLLSTTSLVLGVSAAKDDHDLMMIIGLAGALAGACSMAVGEFVSVSTQRDIQHAAIDDGNNEKNGIDGDGESSDRDVKPQGPKPIRDTNPSPARSPFMKVVVERDIRASGDRTEEKMLPNPYKAALASALAFLCGSLVPLLPAKVLYGEKMRVVGIVIVASLALAVFGGAGARLGGSSVRVSTVRVVVGGWIAMGVTYGLLKPFDRDHDQAD